MGELLKENLSYLKIHVAKLNESIKWYQEQLTFQLKFQYDQIAILEIESDIMLIIMLVESDVCRPETLKWHLPDTNSIQMFKLIKKFGQSAFLFDPSGNKIEIYYKSTVKA